MQGRRSSRDNLKWCILNLKDMCCNAPDGWKQQIAGLLNAAFPTIDGYPTMEEALSEVEHLYESATRMLAAVSDDQVVGFIGALTQYRGHVWELHPLVVRQDVRGCGIGRSLVSALEREALSEGISTITLGTDDVDASTNLGGRRLFPGVLREALAIRDLRGHPFRFYQRLGYEVVGVIPDANGPGKPDIWMAKVLT